MGVMFTNLANELGHHLVSPTFDQNHQDVGHRCLGSMVSESRLRATAQKRRRQRQSWTPTTTGPGGMGGKTMEIHPFSLVIPHTIGFLTTENEDLTI